MKFQTTEVYPIPNISKIFLRGTCQDELRAKNKNQVTMWWVDNTLLLDTQIAARVRQRRVTTKYFFPGFNEAQIFFIGFRNVHLFLGFYEAQIFLIGFHTAQFLIRIS